MFCRGELSFYSQWSKSEIVRKRRWMIFFQQLFRTAQSRIAARFTQLWECSFFRTNISQRSVGTHLSSGGIFNDCSIKHLPPAKEF